MIYIATIPIYLLYIYFVFYYVTKIFGTPLPTVKQIVIISFVNTFLLFYTYFFSHMNFEWLFMILYYLIFALEIHFVCKQSFISTAASTVCFTINFFGTKTLFLGIYTYYSDITISEFLISPENRLVLLIASFAFLTPYIIFSSKILIHKVVRFLFADLASLKLSVFLLSAVCINQFFSTFTVFDNNINSVYNSIYQIRTGLVSLIAFVIIMIVVYIYSKLKEAAITYKDRSDKIQETNLTLHKLEKEVNTDFFTGFSIRSIAIQKLTELISLQEPCYVLFIDIDGLKTVNDNIGHEEGDFYIKSVSELIGEIFVNDTISRIGGDEFLIVGNSKTVTIKNKLELCADKIKNIDSTYETSISYGFIEVDETNTLTPEQLIEIADNEMYKFKKSRNKERKI